MKAALPQRLLPARGTRRCKTPPPVARRSRHLSRQRPRLTRSSSAHRVCPGSTHPLRSQAQNSFCRAISAALPCEAITLASSTLLAEPCPYHGFSPGWLIIHNQTERQKKPMQFPTPCLLLAS